FHPHENSCMKPTLYAHPFSSYSQKVLIALYENATPFEFRTLEDPSANAELAALWPMKKFPLLVDSGRTIIEATTVIEYLHVRYPGEIALIPADAHAALDTRIMDRFFDNYISTPMQTIVLDRRRPEEHRDACGVAAAHAMLDSAYAWLDQNIAGRDWASGAGFTMADCSAAPALFYADWAHPIDWSFANVRAYRDRLLARPSFARAVDEARPYRSYFPLGAPDRD
ncbi:MAG: glutathione S-transferase family protein, partial [Dokdonella sp.]|uniref:glutathione S-transferase family protein n=1 Tax=Dokdonella sp. TaxID=2291710 RepID=UPI0032679D56